MSLQHNHRWDVTVTEAAAIQAELATHVSLKDDFPDLTYVAGIDVGFEDDGKTCRAAVAVLDYSTLALCNQSIAKTPCRLPYIPGYLSFREVPAVLKALDALDPLPGMLLCDGQGIAHPRRLGIASHLGVLTGLPCIGVAKSRLVGVYKTLPQAKGSTVPLMDKNERIGTVLRSRDNVKPLFISPGHRVSMDTSVSIVKACLTKYRLPETTRFAHRLASGTGT